MGGYSPAPLPVDTSAVARVKQSEGALAKSVGGTEVCI